MRGGGSQLSEALAKSAELVGEATCPGKLYMVADYPAAILLDRSDTLVHGEVYRLHNEFMLNEIDDYEECSRCFSEPTEYKRIQAEVKLHDGQALAAWIYVYNHSVERLQELRNGEFLPKASS